MVARKDLLAGIKSLGIKSGDTILVRAGVSAIGKPNFIRNVFG